MRAIYQLSTRVIEVFLCVSDKENCVEKQCYSEYPLSPLKERHELSKTPCKNEHSTVKYNEHKKSRKSSEVYIVPVDQRTAHERHGCIE